MNLILFILSIVLLLMAHFVKIARQTQFIEIYENPPKDKLNKALSITFLLNLILPFKLGNIFRIIYPGKHMKNGCTFSFATIVIDIIVDFFTIAIIYGILFLIGKSVAGNVEFYLIVTLVLLIFMTVAIVFNKFIKKVILKISGIFNEKIELKMLKTSWYSITAFKDMLIRINKVKLFLYTILSIFLYMLSYLCLAKFLTSVNIELNFMNIFNMMYGSGNIICPTLLVFFNYVGLNGLLYLIIYINIPILIIYWVSYFYEVKPKKEKNKKYVELLPHINSSDRLVFLQEYFSAEKAEYLKNYLNLNRDVAIIEDYSAGSNATTMLCSKNGETFYRKYSFGKDADKLHEQIKWIKEHQDKLTLTNITTQYYKNDVCSYDMPYVPGAVTCFNYVHTMPFYQSWENIKSALDDLDKNLHTINRRKADRETIKKYIDSKVIANLEKIKEGKYIKPLLKYEYIYINGKKYHNLLYFEKYLNEEYLSKVFANDNYSNIHGDFTIENIICLKEKRKNQKGYYIIDPNTGNVHDSPYLDYAKLLQSIHGGYEFLMNTKSVTYYDNKIDFLFTKSNTYYQLFEKYIGYLEDKFGTEGLKSIFYHEIIHWLRLMPYKINKNGECSLLFYAGLIMVTSDIEKRFEK